MVLMGCGIGMSGVTDAGVQALAEKGCGSELRTLHLESAKPFVLFCVVSLVEWVDESGGVLCWCACVTEKERLTGTELDDLAELEDFFRRFTSSPLVPLERTFGRQLGGAWLFL